MDKVPNKRKNQDFINVYLKKVESILNIDNKSRSKSKKKNIRKHEFLFLLNKFYLKII